MICYLDTNLKKNVFLFLYYRSVGKIKNILVTVVAITNDYSHWCSKNPMPSNVPVEFHGVYYY